MNDIDKLLDIARSQIGITEYPPNSNNVKYNTVYYGQTVYDGLWGCTFPWCVVFVWWCFRAADLKELFFGGGRTANCGTLADYYMEHGQFVTNGYKAGDIVFFDFGSEFQHVGIIEKVNGDGTYTTIEGNTSNYGSQDNGGAVCRKVRLMMNICGAGRPAYKEDEEMTVDKFLKMLENATEAERKEIGAAVDGCISGYRKTLPVPEWAQKQGEWDDAIKHGITDGTRPMCYATRLESAIMDNRCIYGKK